MREWSSCYNRNELIEDRDGLSIQNSRDFVMNIPFRNCLVAERLRLLCRGFCKYVSTRGNLLRVLDLQLSCLEPLQHDVEALGSLWSVAVSPGKTVLIAVKGFQ